MKYTEKLIYLHSSPKVTQLSTVVSSETECNDLHLLNPLSVLPIETCIYLTSYLLNRSDCTRLRALLVFYMATPCLTTESLPGQYTLRNKSLNECR